MTSFNHRETFVADKPRFAGRVGLLAGGGRFPVCFAETARKAGIHVHCVAISGHADSGLAAFVDTMEWTGLAKLGRMIRLFRRANVSHVVMAGKIHKSRAMFDPWRAWNLLPDLRFLRMWWFGRRKDNKDDSLLLTAIDEFRKDGLVFASALEICPDLLAKAGTLTQRTPGEAQRRDIAFGWELAKEMGRLDVGQSVIVKEQTVLAVEAIEGTDEAILRAGKLCRSGGFTVVKVAKPEQDMRFDVPTIGVQTIETMRKAGGTVLAIEGSKTILIDRDETVALADRYGIAIVALTNAGVAEQAA